MPQFAYIALNDRGQEVRGRIDGDDSRAAAAALRGRSLFVVEIGQPSAAAEGAGISQDVTGAIQRFVSEQVPVRNRDRVFFFQQMALMLRTGLTLLQSLEVAREQCPKARLGATIGRLIDALQNGRSFSQALAAQGREFSPLVIRLVETAEASGELDRILDQISQHMERKAELRRKLLSGLMYPAIVVVVSIVVATFLVVGVIPKFAAFFARREAALPWATQKLMDLSQFVQAYGPIIAGGIVAAVAVTVGVYLTPQGRKALDRFLLYVPVVGGLLTLGAMAQFSQTMGLLLTSGVTLLESLRISGTVLGNRAYRDCVSDAGERILRGQDLTSSLRHSIVPRLVTQVIAVGERTGSLATVLEELARFYDRQLQGRIQRLSSMIEPVMTLVIGGMVGFVYFAFFQAIFQLAAGAR